LHGRWSRFRSRGLVKLAQQCTERHDLAFLGRAPDEYAAGCRGNLDRYLIGFQLDQGFAGGHGLSFLLHPAGDCGLNDRLAERWNLDRDHAVKCVRKQVGARRTGANRRR
jgi:hypothetical protein